MALAQKFQVTPERLTAAVEKYVTELQIDNVDTIMADGYQANVSLDAYQMTLGALFCLQLVFCAVVVWHTDRRVKAVETRGEGQRALFYQFMY